jgi:hypothetical protein
MSEPEGVFVGSGSFLVDRRQALDKLMRFQLPNPAAFALAWARCASAGDASGYAVATGTGIFTATFDGRPFTKAELEDPYRCLFEKRTPESDRNRQLAVGLLSVLRLKPDSIRITSGRGGERCTLDVVSLEEESFIEPEGGDHTVVTVSWPSLDYAVPREAAELVRTGCVLSPLEVSVDGVILPAWTESAEERTCFEDDASRGWVAVPRTPAEESELELCWHGTVVERITIKLPLIQVRGAINDDAFTLNASQAGVVRDARYEAALKRLAEPSQALVVSTARSLAASPVGPLLQDPYFRRRWRETLEDGREKGEFEGAFGGVIDAAQTLWTMASRLDVSTKEEAVVGRARSVRWLRRLCARRLRPRTKDSKDEVLNALWSAPLYVAADGTPMSLDEMAEQRKKLSYIPVCAEPAPGLSLPFRPLWSVSFGEAELPSRLLGVPSRDVTPTIEALKNDPQRRGGAASFEKAGLAPPLIRVPIALGKVRGEVGLSSQPEVGRLHLLTQGLPSGVVELEGGLRFEAVVSDDDRVWDDALTANDKELCAALSALARNEAIGLYRRISQEYDPGAASARAAAIRAHLIDYLGFVVRLNDAETAADGAWIRSIPLFQDRDGRWIDHATASSALRTEPLYAARQGQEYAWQDGKNLILDPDFNAARLTSLFPGCVRLPIRGRAGVFALVPALTGCAVTPAAGRCVAAFQLGGQAVHGVLPASENPGEFSWDKLTVHAADGGGSELTGHQELVLELMLAVVRQDGPLLDTPDAPLRRFLLKALGLAPAPWAGAAGKSLWEAFRGKPVFRSPFSEGRTLEDVFAALHVAGGRLTYAATASPSGPQPDVLLDAVELEALRRFQPLGAENLQLFGGAARARPIAPAEPEEPAPSNFLSVFRGKPYVRSNERFMIERRYAGKGLDVWFGLSTRLPPPPPACIDGGPSIDLSKLPPLASVLVDTGAAVDAAGAIPALMDFLRQFYEEIAARWPIAKRPSPAYVTAERYLLEALRLSAFQPDLFTGWAPVLRKIRDLKLFADLHGGLLSLDEVAELTAQDGVLLFGDPALPVPAIDEGRAIPVLRYPKVVAEILSVRSPVKVKRYKPAPLPVEAPRAAPRPVILVEPAPEPDGDAAPATTGPNAFDAAQRTSEDLARRNPVVEAAFRLLAGLSGRKGLKLPRHELSDLRLDNGFDGTLLIQEGAWTLNSDDALVKAILASSLSDDEQSAYLASVAYTASNRLKNVVTDLDDIRFQEALADTL